VFVAAKERKFMHGRKGVFWVAVCLMFILLLGNMMPIDNSDGLTSRVNEAIEEPKTVDLFLAGTPHAPIAIDGDANFSDTATMEGWPGDGLYETPYIINGLDINLDGSPGHCISISNTRVNFTISNCNLAGASVDPGAGIYLDNVQNAIIVGTICQLNTHGVLVQGRGSRNCVLINNTCIQNAISGIQLAASLNITVAQNNCSSNYYGINIIDLIGQSGHSGEHIIANNFCYNNSYGICLGDFNVESIGPLFTMVVNNNCSSNYEDGIRILNPGYHTISKNNCNRNGASGILLRLETMNNTLVENNCNENNQSGIYFYSSIFYSNLTNNTCSGNSEYGLYIRPFDNMLNDFQWNVFDNLIGNAYDGSGNNNFDYNYWSDYTGTDADEDGFGDTAYTSGLITDNYPLMFAPTRPKWTEVPIDQTIEFGTHFLYDLNATAPAPIFWSVIWDSWTAQFTIDSQGVLESIGNLSPGDYELLVTVTNFYGASIFARFEVNVVLTLDTTNPSWVVTPMDLTIEYGAGVNLLIHALDLSGIDHWSINDTTHFTLSATYYDLGSTARITNISVLEPASYGLNITAYDPFDNSCSATFVVTVLEIPTITTTTTTTSSTIDQLDPLLALGLGAGIGGAVVIAIVIVFLRRSFWIQRISH
jgi:parallel beta-helix repeat protein